jgi:hypothetical protein
MLKMEDLKAELISLQAELDKIQSEGRVLTDCWIAKAKPGSKKNKYPRLKSRKPIFNGKKDRVSEYSWFSTSRSRGSDRPW